jgi:hypothetical protein
MRGSADNEPDPDERIDDTQKNEVRRFSQEIGETFGQSVLEIRGADLGTCAPWRMGTFLLFVWYQVRLGRHSYLPLRDTLKGIHRSCAAFVALNLRPAETSLNHLIDDFFNTFLQILPVHSFEKIELFRAFQDVDTENPSPQSNNQLNLFDS